MKFLFLVSTIVLINLVSLRAQSPASVKEWPMPSGHVTGLSKPGFKVLPVLSFENIRGEKRLILKMDISMGTVKDPVAPFSYRYTYRGKEYTDKELGMEPFSFIRMKTADFTVLVQGPRMSQKVEYEYITGRYDLGAVSRDVGLSAYSVQVQSLDNVFYGGAEHLEKAIKVFEETGKPPVVVQKQPDPVQSKTADIPKQQTTTTTVQPVVAPVPKADTPAPVINKAAVDTAAAKKTTPPEPAISAANSLEARAAFSLAEESYLKGDMRLAVQYLDEAASKLGKPNARILYMKVKALKALSEKDAVYGTELDAAITDFEKAPDIADFNEDRLLEVMKIKLERKRQKNMGAELEKGLGAIQKETGWWLNMRADSLVLTHKELFDKYFQANPAKKGKLTTDGFEIFNQTAGTYEAITLNGGFLRTYTRMFFSGDDRGYARLKEKSPAIIEYYKQFFGYLPVLDKKTTTTPSGNSTITVNTYSYKWKFNGAAFYLIYQETAYSLGNMSTCFITLTNDPSAL